MHILLMVAWAASVTSPDPRERAQAAHELRRAASRPEALRTLVKLLGDAEPEVRAAAADAIGEFDADSQPAVRALISCLQDPAERVRERAAYSLGRIGPGAAEAIPYLTPLLTERSYMLRWQGVQALGGIGPAAAGTRNHMLTLWNDENEYVRAAAVTALSGVASYPEEAYPYLVPALRDPSVNVRRAAASGFSQWAAGSAAVLPEIRKALHDADYTVQGAAMGALFRMPKREAQSFVDDMIEALNNPANHFSQRAAAADFLGGMGQAAAVAAPDLRHALNDPHDWVSRAAGRALGRLNLPRQGPSEPRPAKAGVSAVALAAARLADPDAAVRVAALRELAKFKEQVTPYAAAIAGRLAAGNEDEKRAALDALSGMRTNTEPVMPSMLAALGDESLRPEVLRAFERMGPGAVAAVPALVKILESGDSSSLHGALRAISEIGRAAEPAAGVLARLLSAPQVEVKLDVLYALNHLGPAAAAALPAMYGALDDSNPKVRGDAAYAIGQVFVCNDRCAPLPAQAGGRLVELLSDADTGTREHAAYALMWARPLPAGATRALAVAMDDSNFQVRGQAARALARTGSGEALRRLASALDDPSWQVRQGSAWALAELGDAAKPALGALRKALADPNVEVQRAAKRAIEAIER